MAMAKPTRTVLAAAASLVLASSANVTCAGVLTPDTSVSRSGVVLEPVQYGYGYRPYGYGYGYRPYGYYPYRRFYNNHFGPGAAKERHRTRLDYCIKRPSQC